MEKIDFGCQTAKPWLQYWPSLLCAFICSYSTTSNVADLERPGLAKLFDQYHHFRLMLYSLYSPRGSSPPLTERVLIKLSPS